MKGEEIIKRPQQRLEAVYEDQSHPKENLVLMKRYLRRGIHAGLSWETIQNDIKTFIVFSRWCTIPIPELTEDDIYDFLDYLRDHTYLKCREVYSYSPYTVTFYKRILRKFFRDNNKPELLDSLKERLKSKKLIEKDQLPDKTTIEDLLNACENSRDRAIISTLHEAGPRKGEILSPLVKHAVFDSNGVKLTFPEGKTGPRTVRLVFASRYLRDWVQDHPIKKDGRADPDAPLFVSHHGNNKRLSDNGLYNQLRKIAKRAGVTKKVNPHSFRHARATELAEHLTEQQMKKFLGWRPDSKMCSVYVHDPDTEQAILKLHGLKVEDTYTDGLRVGRCPWCKELNPESYSFCGVCGRPLTQDAQDSITEYENKINLIYSVMDKILGGDVTQEEIKNVIKMREKDSK